MPSKAQERPIRDRDLGDVLSRVTGKVPLADSTLPVTAYQNPILANGSLSPGLKAFHASLAGRRDATDRTPVVSEAAPKAKAIKVIPSVAKEWLGEKYVDKAKPRTTMPRTPAARQQTVKINLMGGIACGSNATTVASSGMAAFVRTALVVLRSK